MATRDGDEIEVNQAAHSVRSPHWSGAKMRGRSFPRKRPRLSLPLKPGYGIMPSFQGRKRLRRHLRKVVAQRHVPGELFLRDLLFDLELSAFHPADVAVDDADVILLADQLVALWMGERVLHLHPLERLDHALDVLAGFVSGLLDRRLEREDVLPGLPAVALVHDALAADLACIDIVD